MAGLFVLIGAAVQYQTKPHEENGGGGGFGDEGAGEGVLADIAIFAMTGDLEIVGAGGEIHGD